jgi:predicted  nucleic acid-binding Zn-ribbon protein
MSEDKMKKGSGKDDISKLGSNKLTGNAPQPPTKTPQAQTAVPGKQPATPSKFGSPATQQPVKSVVGSKTPNTVGTPSNTQASADATPINTAEIAAAVSALQTRFTSFLSRVNLSSYEQRISDITNKVTSLPADVAAIRSRGYAFRSFLENKAQVLGQQWQQAQERIQTTVRNESQVLRRELDQAELLMQKLTGNTATQSQLVPNLQSALDSLEAKIGAAESLIEGMCSSLERELQQTRGQIDEINTIMDKKEAASFSFNLTEAVFLVAEAEWSDDSDTPNGNLFLTDQRLVFEQAEKTGKKLGLFGGKDVQEMKWEFPLTSIEAVEAENKGLLGGKDMLNFTLGSGASYGKLTVEVKGGVDCKLWAGQIKRMMSGNTQDERAIEPDPELIERLRNAPTSCHICGGTLPQITAGQNSVTCPYCGVVVRV